MMLVMNKTIIFLIITLLIATPKNTVKAAKPEKASVVSTATEITTNTLELETIVASTLLAPIPQVTPVAIIEPEPVKPRTLKQQAEELVTATFGPGQFRAFDTIVQKESGWNPNAVNKSSGACGLPQALPCSKIKDRSPEGQLAWMVNYIKSRYGTPNNAWTFWQAHKWY